MSNKVLHFAVNELPTSDNLVEGGIYYLSSGEQYIIGTNKSLYRISDVIFTDALPILGQPNKIYIYSDNTTNTTKLLVWEGLEYVEISNNSKSPTTNTFIFFTNKLSSGEVQTRAKLPYNAKITKLETILTNSSVDILSYSLEKSTDGITFTQVNINESIPVEQVMKTTNITSEVLVNKDDVLRLVLSTDNKDIDGLTANITIEEV